MSKQRDAAQLSASELIKDELVWDAHAGFETLPGMPLERLSAWKNAGVDFLSLNVGYDVWNISQCMHSVAFARAYLSRSEEFTQVQTFDDIERARANGQMAVAFDLEGTEALDGSIEMLDLYYSLGVRQILFAYNRNNRAGGGCHDLDVGLTPFGRRVVQRMNDLGILVDCSHCSYKTSLEVMERSCAPVIFSHSNAKALVDHERNIVEEQALRCAATNGVIGVNGIDLFLGGSASATKLADHVEYFFDLVGPSHVGLGLDYFFDNADGSESEIAGFNDVLATNAQFWPPSQYPEGKLQCMSPTELLDLTEVLCQRHYSAVEISGLLGGNFARVARQVWR